MDDNSKRKKSPPPKSSSSSSTSCVTTIPAIKLNDSKPPLPTKTINQSSQNESNNLNKKSNKNKNLKEIDSESKNLNNSNKTKLVRSNDLLSQSSTETLLEMLKSHTGIKECTEETVNLINGILTELYTRVKGARGSWRGAVLGALYGLVECTSAKILLSVARVVLVVCK